MKTLEIDWITLTWTPEWRRRRERPRETWRRTVAKERGEVWFRGWLKACTCAKNREVRRERTQGPISLKGKGREDDDEAADITERFIFAQIMKKTIALCKKSSSKLWVSNKRRVHARERLIEKIRYTRRRTFTFLGPRLDRSNLQLHFVKHFISGCLKSWR